MLPRFALRVTVPPLHKVVDPLVLTEACVTAVMVTGTGLETEVHPVDAVTVTE